MKADARARKHSLLDKLHGCLLSEVPPKTTRLTDASLLELWFVQRTRGDTITYDVWTPASRSKSVPWAYGPCPHRGISRSAAIELLREHWIPDFEKYLSLSQDLVQEVVMIAVYAPTSEIADKFIAMKGFSKASCLINPNEWHMRGRTPEYCDVYVVNGGPDLVTGAGLKLWLESGHPVNAGSVKE